MDSEIINKIIETSNLDFPDRVLNTILKVGYLNPGLKSKAIIESGKHIKHLISGGFIVIAGNPGNGKTTAACILALEHFIWTKFNPYKKYIKKHPEEADYSQRPEPSITFKTSSDILSDNFNRKAQNELFYETWGLLIIDDFGSEYSSVGDWTSSIWDKVINHRYSGQLPTILTTNLTRQELTAKYNERIIDRFNECAKFVIVKEKSFRGDK